MPENGTHDMILRQETLATHFAEAYRALRANINFSAIDQAVKTIVVTSASTGEGKTTTVINLGIIMAQASPRVLIVDADFRRPSIHALLGVWPNNTRQIAGLSDVIVGKANVNDVIMETGFDRLGLVPAGTVPPNPGELLGSQRMHAVMQELANLADYIVVDTPPCLVYADAFLVSRLADGVLYVVRAGSQNKAAQRRVQKQLEQAKVRMLGVVFNGVEADESASTYGYYYANGNKRRK
jgi:capsular exopolysaccharide synthesis family protein